MLECWGSFGLIFSSLSRLNTAGVHICKGCSSKTQNLMSHTGRVETGAQVCMFSCLFFKRMNRRPVVGGEFKLRCLQSVGLSKNARGNKKA